MIENLNNLPIDILRNELEKCCGSSKWISEMVKAVPYSTVDSIHNHCDLSWKKCQEDDYLEAFKHHPQIGNIQSLKEKFASTSNWASNEQKGTSDANENILQQLKSGNDAYLKKFGFIFIVCATGKSAEQMLDLLNHRLPNNRNEELQIAAAEQNNITHLRLDKLLSN